MIRGNVRRLQDSNVHRCGFGHTQATEAEQANETHHSPGDKGTPWRGEPVYLVDLVHLVCLVHLVDLVCFVYLVVSFVQPKNQTK